MGAALAVIGLTVTACSSGGDEASTSTASTSERSEATERSTATTAEEAADATETTDESTEANADDTSDTTAAAKKGEAGLFDFNQDGDKERTCGTRDLTAGLAVRTYCDDLSGYANEPASGASLLATSLLSLPTPPDDPRDLPITAEASVSPQHLQSADGRELAVYTLTSDTVFATGSDELLDPATASLTSIAKGLLASYPGAGVTFEVRGHTDATGDDASNLALSQRRAERVAEFLVSAGLAPARVRAIGLGETTPNYAEDSDVGRDENRRIELVVRL